MSHDRTIPDLFFEDGRNPDASCECSPCTPGDGASCTPSAGSIPAAYTPFAGASPEATPFAGAGRAAQHEYTPFAGVAHTPFAGVASPSSTTPTGALAMAPRGSPRTPFACCAHAVLHVSHQDLASAISSPRPNLGDGMQAPDEILTTEAAVVCAVMDAELAEGDALSSDDEGGEDECGLNDMDEKVPLDGEALQRRLASFCSERPKGEQVSEKIRRDAHFKSANASHPDFVCRCAIARAAGSGSCLDSLFNKAELRRLHEESYGAGAESGSTVGSPVHLADVSKRIHACMWELAEPMKAPDQWGRKYQVKTWRLLGREVCKKAWQQARGGSAHLHRTRLAWVRLGHSPATLGVANAAALVHKTDRVKTGVDADRERYAIDWWKRELFFHSWLPNENAIQVKGPPWNMLHTEHYVPSAEANSGAPALKYQAWKQKMLLGARELGTMLDDCPDVSKLRVTRSARHSNFPECTTCSRLRARYNKVWSTPGSSPAERKQATDDLSDHMTEWKKDREVALRFRYMSMP